jgi:protein-L-isoaspartate(D-aspartate) O-methyltransferase
VPNSLIAQLAEGGVLVAPVGSAAGQRIVRLRRFGTRTIETPLLPCRFVKLLGKEGWEDES